MGDNAGPFGNGGDVEIHDSYPLGNNGDTNPGTWVVDLVSINGATNVNITMYALCTA